ncbi:unnamed protein product [Ectocarpus sp. 12 AP-2014]
MLVRRLRSTPAACNTSIAAAPALPAARDRGVWSYLSRAPESAPCFTRAAIALGASLTAAVCRGVRPPSSLASTSTLALSTRKSIMGTLLCLADSCRRSLSAGAIGVSCIPASRSTCATSSWPP